MPERKPFDPSRIRRPKPTRSGGTAEPEILSVRQVNEMIAGVLRSHLPAKLHVVGQIGTYRPAASGHVYFTLKDDTSELSCVLWRSTVRRLKFEPEVGLEVVATGEIDVYPPRGSYQLIVTRLDPRGVGALELAFRQLHERLEREGLFATERKRPLPRLPRRIGIVTSPTGAAIRDILQTLARRFPAVDVLIAPCRVQGSAAAPEIAAAIRMLNAHADALGGIDVLIVGRGGGSQEDLWTFNEEVVARAISASRIPIISAVGHEIDTTISDLVADVRAPTPTAAAEIVAPPLEELLSRIDDLWRRSARVATRNVQLARAELSATLAYDGLARPLGRLRQHVQQVDELQHRMRQVLHERLHAQKSALHTAETRLLRTSPAKFWTRMRNRIDQRTTRLAQSWAAHLRQTERRLTNIENRRDRKSPVHTTGLMRGNLSAIQQRLARATSVYLRHRNERLRAYVRMLSGCDPRAILRRGYSITRDARSGKVIRSVEAIRDRQRILTELADGEFYSNAEDPRQPTLFDPPK